MSTLATPLDSRLIGDGGRGLIWHIGLQVVLFFFRKSGASATETELSILHTLLLGRANT